MTQAQQREPSKNDRSPSISFHLAQLLGAERQAACAKNGATSPTGEIAMTEKVHLAAPQADALRGSNAGAVGGNGAVLMPAHITRLMTFAQHGQPKDYGGSDMMRADLEALIITAACASDLRKELEHAVRWFDQLKPEDIARYRAALAKARGE